MFKINNLEFNIDSAIIDAFFDEDDMTVNWGLKVSGCGVQAGLERWKPVATVEVVLSLVPGEISNWKQLSGFNVSWSSKYNENSEMHGSLYVFEHNPIYESRIVFDCEKSGLTLDWSAKSYVNGDDECGESASLTIRTPICFEGIWCGKKTKSDCFKVLEKFFNIEDFKYIKTEHGVSLLVPS